MMNIEFGEHLILVQGPQTLITQHSTIQDVIRVLDSPETPTITVPESEWWPFVDLIKDAERHLGMILNTNEEEWIEGSDNVSYFGRECAQAIGKDQRLDPILIKISELADRQAAAGLPIVITT